MDLSIMALSSDLTRVITLLCSDGDAGGLVMPFLGSDFKPSAEEGGLGNNNSHHSNSHGENSKHVTMQRWFVEQFAYFVKRMKETGLFSQSLVYVVNNMNTGGGHGVSNLPVFIAGNVGVLRTGRYLKGNRNLKELHAGVARAMGADLEGQAEYPGLRG